MEFIDKVIEEDEGISSISWKLLYFENVDLAKSHNRRDFGKGFYTTILKTQSKNGPIAYLSVKRKSYFIYEYLFVENQSLRVKRFDSLNKEWLNSLKKIEVKEDTA